MDYYAHSKGGCSTSEWHRLQEHLQATAEKAWEFAEPWGAGDWAWNAGWLHDLGKVDSRFQDYLRRENGLDAIGYDFGHVNHSSAGAACAEDQIKQAGRILAYLVAGHHAGLPDWDTAETGQAALSFRLGEGHENLKRVTAFAEEVMAKLRPAVRPHFVSKDNFHFWVRMLFSCLVDADFLDTEQFMQCDRTQERGRYPALAELAPRLFAALDELERNAARSDVNTIRAEIRRACEREAEKSKGLFSLTVPTGGGKTLSAMAFALRHALKHGHQRIIYVIPYTSIIEQTGRTLAGIFGRENVVEHHSNLSPEKETLRSQLATENWDAPIIVTTNVQFFESLYAAKPSRCRKLHNIANSVVILDEAQLLPPELLTPCVDAMKDLVAIRTFGAVMSTGANAGQVRGPVQMTFGRSVERIVSLEHSITRMAVATEEEAEKQSGDNRTMGRKNTVPYGLYVAHGFVSAHLANQTKFTDADLELLWDALKNMFEHDRSAARGLMSTQKLIVFKHASALGNAPSYKLFDLVKVERANDSDKPARAFADYRVTIDRAKIPQGVELIELL